MITYTKSGININGEDIHINEIISKINKIKIQEDKKVLFTISWDGYRRGFDGIEEKIILNLDTANKLSEYLLGITVYFGEIAGKHSDVWFTISKENLHIEENHDVILGFLNNNPSEHIYNHSALYNIYDRYIESLEWGDPNELVHKIMEKGLKEILENNI